MPAALGFLGGLFSIGAAPALGSAAFGAWAVGAGLSTTCLGSLAVRLTISVAASALSAALQPRPQAAGLRTTTTLRGGVVPESAILGKSATGGVFVCPPMSPAAWPAGRESWG